MNAIIKAPLHGEILGPQDVVTVRAVMHPFRSRADEFDVPVGQTLDEIAGDCIRRGGVSITAKGLVIEIDGESIEPEMWHLVRPKGGRHVFVRAVARGGGFFKSVLMLALVVLSAFIGGPFGIATLGLGTVGAAIASTAILIGGTLLLNALFPPASLKSNNADRLYSIGGTRNEVSKWGPIPVVFGKIRCSPKFAATPYTEFADDDQFVRNLYVLAQGPLKLDAEQLGETALSKFDDIEFQKFGGLPGDSEQSIYPAEVVQDDYSIEVTKADSPFTRAVAEEAAEVQFDLLAPVGIVNIQTKSGKKKRQECSGYATLTDFTRGNEIARISWDMSDNDTNPKRKTFRFPNLPGTGQYNINVYRTTQDYDDDEDSDRVDNVTLTAVRVFRNSPPIEYRKPLAKMAMRIRATKQLSGNPDNLNVMAQALAPTWNGTSWVLNKETANCASMGLLALMGQGIAQPLSFADIDQNSWVRFFLYCELYGFKFNMYRDFASSVYDTLSDILAAGRGVRTNIDGKVGVSFEDPDAQVKQHFTPRNSWDFSVRITYAELPHALRCKFINEKKNYEEDEKLVYFDGYNKTNATLFVEVEFPGVTDPDLIYRHGRYRIAEMVTRPAVYTVTTDFEHIVVNRGDRVRLTHDVLQSEVLAARVKSRSNVSGGVRVEIDEILEQIGGKSYNVRCRCQDGTSRVYTISSTSEVRSYFIVPSAEAAAFQQGDLVVFGPAGLESAVYRVLRIRRMKDLNAKLELVDDAPGIMTADIGPVPPGPGEVITPPPLAEYRPYGLSAKQFIDPNNGIRSQITRIFWQIKPGGPEMSSFLVVAIDDDGKEYRATTANGYTFALDYVNLPTSNYTVLVQGFTADGRYTGFSDPFYLSQSLPEDGLGPDLDFAKVQEEFQDAFDKFVTESQAELDERVDLLRGEISDLAGAAVGPLIQQEETKRSDADGVLATRIDTVQAVADDAGARVTSEAATRANNDTALGQRIDTTLARANNAAAAVQTEQSARISADSALGQQITAVLAQANQATASGYYKIEATAGANGRARFLVFLNAGTPSNPNWASTGMIMEAWIEGGQPRSRILMKADSFAIHNGQGAQAVPFIVSGGVVYIDTAYIRDLKAANIAINGVDMLNLIQGAAANMAMGYLQAGGSLSIQTRGGRVMAMLRATLGLQYQSSNISLYRNGAQVQGMNLFRTMTAYTPQQGATYGAGFNTSFAIDSPPEGYNTYTLSSATGVNNVILWLFEQRR